MNVLGLKISGHDTGAALIAGGRVVAIAQERLDRTKYSGAFPQKSIDYCLTASGVAHLGAVDVVAIEQYTPTTEPLIRLLGAHGLWPKLEPKTIFVNHHDAHAASAFFCSPFHEAAVMVVDNAGQTADLPAGYRGVETESFYRGQDNQLTRFARNFAPVNCATGGLAGISGVGNFYSQVTYFLGFGKHEEGKTMGLAPYGTGQLAATIPPEHFIRQVAPLQYVFPTPLEPHPDHDWRYLFKRSAYSRRRGWENRFAMAAHRLAGYRAPAVARRLFPRRPELFSRMPRREHGVPLPDGRYTEVAAWAQQWLERVMIDYAATLHRVTGSPNLCLAGGVGLNSVANKKILDAAPFENIFVQPAAGDSGLPLGAALWVLHQVKGSPVAWRMTRASLGRRYAEPEILDALAGCRFRRVAHPAKVAAQLIAEGKIIGWFQGGSEYGPRALGNRSILCSPIPPGMKDKLNTQVKHRESFRPFAPAVLEDRTAEYFALRHPSPFMLLVAQVKKDNIPAVTHTDGSGRVQTVSPAANPLFHALISEFAHITGVPVVLNTSFNDNGQPIVETPADAIAAFRTTNLDALVIHDFVVEP